MKKNLLVSVLASTFISYAQGGTVTVNFSAFDAGVAQNFANSTGVVSNNLFYGIIIDSSGDGFLPGYRAVSLALSSSYILNTTSDIQTDDILVLSAFQTGNTNFLTEADMITTGGPGGIFDVADIVMGGTVTASDIFRVIWFDGNVAGTLSDPSFVLPTDGNSVDLTGPFVGVDVVRQAGFSYSGTSGVSSLGIAFLPVPEPSTMILGAFGALALLRRRRN